MSQSNPIRRFAPFWAISDQAFVSGTNFLTTIIVGNACGAEGLGLYALGATVIIFSIAAQSALIGTPLAVKLNRLSTKRQRTRLGSSLVHAILQILFVVLVVGLLSITFSSNADAYSISLALLLAIPFSLLREFYRRVCFCSFDLVYLNLLDSLVSMIQLGTLMLLWHYELLTPNRAFVVIASACCLATCGYFLIRRRRFSFRSTSLPRDLRTDIQLGKFVFLEQVFTFAAVYILPWLVAFYLDELQVGIFAACVSVTGLANPFLMGLGNYVLPRIAISLNEQSYIENKKLIRKYNFLVFFLASPIVLVCVFFGEPLVEMFYSDPEYAGKGTLIMIVAIRMALSASGLISHFALLAVNKPLRSFVSSITSVVVTCALSPFLIPQYQLIGAAIAWLIGTLAETAILLAFAFIELRRYFRNG